jgi:hypothetical protein
MNKLSVLTAARYLLFLLLIGTSFQCKKGRVSNTFNPAFTEKITAFTSGVISSESTIRIILAEDNPHAGDVNTPAGDDLFRFKPTIKGQAVWIDKRTIEFRPSEKLVSGQTYQARFKLGKIVKVKKELSVLNSILPL